ncbi:serine/threonine-protein kinase [Leifsonia sp. AG29]|uniref:serine/threonine-protein kinase n=1 Tax=Leifsonia sp. AG29 TaxID=2598860 RepID=UPI00131C44CA|nr:serine/threonine-protein kinase [Leifsonia sp. AG29]
MASQPPELEGLHLIRLLGSGGFSDVFLYEQDLPRRSVAVKVLLTDSVDDAARARFVAEANVMARLSAHPYIVTIFHAGVSRDDRPYLVMEYCSGPSLADRLRRERIGVEDALRTGIRLSSAVATAHAAGILHRDIKPANVLTNALGWPALTDFGIASALEELPVHTTTLSELRRAGGTGATGNGTGDSSRSVGLSVPWSPPEMFADDPEPDVRSDIFSLAATVHTLLAGRTPFEVPGRSNGTLDLMGRIERGMITRIDRDDIPPSLTAVLRRGMATRQADRYQSAIDFARALQRVELELGLAATGIDVPNVTVTEERGPSQDGSDAEPETRARSVATVRAQQPAAPEATRVRGVVPVVPMGAAPAEVRAPEQTVVRPPRPSDTSATDSSDDGAGAGTADAEEARRRDPRKRLLAWIGAGAAAVVVLGVAAALVANALAPATPSAPRAGSARDGTVAVTIVPPPQLVTAERSTDRTTATFTWKTKQPKPGDQFTWVREGTTDPPAVTAEQRITVTGLQPSQSVCIDVATIRSGRTSEQLRACAQ